MPYAAWDKGLIHKAPGLGKCLKRGNLIFPKKRLNVLRLDFCFALGHGRLMDLLNLSVYILVPAVVIFLFLLLVSALGYGAYSLVRRAGRKRQAGRKEGAP